MATRFSSYAVSRTALQSTCLALCFCCVSTSLAQPVPSRDPWSTHIFPAGARQGTKLRVRVGAECVPPYSTFSVYGKGLSTTQPTLLRKLPERGEPSPRRLPTEVPITYPKEWESTLKVEKNAPLGVAYWHISCAQGGSASRPFIIGDLPEFIEKESNSSPARAEQVSLPVTINGQISGERDMDYYRFKAVAGQVVVCEVLAQRLGSRLDPVVEIRRMDGSTVKAQELRIGNDPVVAFRAADSGEYLLRIGGLTKYGNPAFVYRVNLTAKPFVHFALPAGGVAGTKQKLSLYVLTGAGYKVVEHTVAIPQRIGEFQIRHPQNSSRAIRLLSSQLPQIAEDSKNGSATAATRITKPIIVYGRFESANDTDWYQVNIPQGETWEVVCRAYPAGSTALPVVQVRKTGAAPAIRRSVDSADGVCKMTLQGSVQVRLSDLRLGAQGGPNFQYQLQVGPQRKDFQLRSGHNYTGLLQGQSANIAITVDRQGGFKQPISLSVTGLPRGVTASNLKVAGNATSHSIKLTATADAASAGYAIGVTGKAKIDGKTVERKLLATHLGRDSQNVAVGSPYIDRINVGLKHKPVFRLYCSEAYMYAHRGSIYPYAMEIERLGNFNGPITVQIGDRQNRDLDGVRMIETKIRPGQSDFFLPIYLPETMFINVQSQSQLYSQAYAVFKDKHNRRQSVLVVSEKRNMIRTLPPVVKIKAARQKFLTSPATSLDCRLVLERTSNFPGKMNVKLLVPKEYSGLIKLERPCVIAKNATSTIAEIRVTDKAQGGMKIPVVLRASGEMHAGNVAVTEAKIVVTIR